MCHISFILRGKKALMDMFGRYTHIETDVHCTNTV